MTRPYKRRPRFRSVAYRVCFFLSLAFVGAIVILSWLAPEHLR